MVGQPHHKNNSIQFSSVITGECCWFAFMISFVVPLNSIWRNFTIYEIYMQFEKIHSFVFVFVLLFVLRRMWRQYVRKKCRQRYSLFMKNKSFYWISLIYEKKNRHKHLAKKNTAYRKSGINALGWDHGLGPLREDSKVRP